MNKTYFARVNQEVDELNHSPSLRTTIKPDPNDELGLYYFTMLPNDGPMANLPIIGRMYIPETYPMDPPVIHVFTKTNRYNVDAFHKQGLTNNKNFSSLCFDILRSKENKGIWLPEYTISCLFASLMQAIVCYDVPQQYGPDKPEAVSMENLAKLKQTVLKTFEEYVDKVPPITLYEKVEALAISTCNILSFDPIISTHNNTNEKIVHSQPFDLVESMTCSFDLSDLKNNPNVIFSIILSNDPSDPFGKKPKTILVRDGVTATAAKKTQNKSTKWFYHGIPMNDGVKQITVTLYKKQFTFSYLDETSGKMLIFGDSVVSFLHGKEFEINDKFFLSLYLKKKLAQSPQISIKTIDTNIAYIHPSNKSDILEQG
jgi:ubiquitin-protein ligase